MAKTAKKYSRRQRIRAGIRSKISGTAERPRLCVYRSNKQIYAQLIDDRSGVTIAAASSLKISGEGKTKSEVAGEVGKALGTAAKTAGVETVVFDRGGYLYHGRVKALAEGARETGLVF